jgi:spermidine synthase
MARVYGDLAAWSTVGSIFGTFTTGYYLLFYLSHRMILVGTAALLLLIAAFWLRRARDREERFGLIVCAATALLLVIASLERAPAGKIEVETVVNRYWISENTQAHGQRRVRWLETAHGMSDAAIYLDGKTDELVFRYLQHFDLFRLFVRHPSRALMLGGSGQTYSAHFVRQNPDALLDVVEIDPGLLSIARSYFGFEPSPRIRVFHEDGRTYINETRETYDTIFVDTMQASGAMPFHLTTVEFLRNCERALRPGGALVMHVLSHDTTGANSLFLDVQTTFRKVFPQVIAFQMYPLNPARLQSFVLIAARTQAPPDASTLDRATQALWASRMELAGEGRVLTDDFAPVEYMNPRLPTYAYP